MKIIIDHSNTKREINGGFLICGSKRDLECVLNNLKEALDSHKNFSYGWISIYDMPPIKPNTNPQSWD